MAHIKLFLILICLTFSIYIRTQEIIKVDPKISEEFISPLIEGISGSMNSGWFQHAPKTTFAGFDIEFGLIGMGTFLNNDQKTFNSSSNIKLPESTIDKMIESVDIRLKGMVKDSLMNRSFLVNFSGPTAIGSNSETVQIIFPGDTISVNYMGEKRSVLIPAVNIDSKVKGLNLPVTPLATLQLSLGTLAGSKFTIRYTPPIYLSNDIGSISSFGVGIQHNPMIWFSKKPVIDLSLVIFMQKLKIGNIFSSTSLQYGIFASKTFGGSTFNVTPFTGLTMEQNNSNIRYEYNYTDNFGNSGKMQIELDLSSETSVRFRTGASIKLSVVNLSLTYGYSIHHSLSAGFGFIF